MPYEERLRILRAALAPTADRGAWSRDGHRQDHFAATDHGWRVTCETAYGHQLRVAFPPSDEEHVRRLVLDIIDRMGCQATSILGRAAAA